MPCKVWFGWLVICWLHVFITHHTISQCIVKCRCLEVDGQWSMPHVTMQVRVLACILVVIIVLQYSNESKVLYRLTSHHISSHHITGGNDNFQKGDITTAVINKLDPGSPTKRMAYDLFMVWCDIVELHFRFDQSLRVFECDEVLNHPHIHSTHALLQALTNSAESYDEVMLGGYQSYNNIQTNNYISMRFSRYSFAAVCVLSQSLLVQHSLLTLCHSCSGQTTFDAFITYNIGRNVLVCPVALW